MIYKFYKTPCNHCMVEIGDTGKAYVTDWIDYYDTEAGRESLIPHTEHWGTVYFNELHCSACIYVGWVHVPPHITDAEDISTLKRCIGKEGFDYAMLHYSDYKSVPHNTVSDKEFHRRHDNLIRAYNELRFYLNINGIDTD